MYNVFIKCGISYTPHFDRGVKSLGALLVVLNDEGFDPTAVEAYVGMTLPESLAGETIRCAAWYRLIRKGEMSIVSVDYNHGATEIHLLKTE